MQDRTETTRPARQSRQQINHDALVMRVLDLERRVTAVENTMRVTTRTLHFLVDSEVARIAADFTPEQIAEVREAMRLEVERITAEIAARQAAGR